MAKAVKHYRLRKEGPETLPYALCGRIPATWYGHTTSVIAAVTCRGCKKQLPVKQVL